MRCGPGQIDNRSFTVLKDDDSTQVVNRPLHSQRPGGSCCRTGDDDSTFSIDMIIISVLTKISPNRFSCRENVLSGKRPDTVWPTLGWWTAKQQNRTIV